MEIKDCAFKTHNELICKNSNFSHILKKMFNNILEEESNFQSKGSGWSLKSIDGLQLRINYVNPFKASSFIDLPKNIKNKNAIIINNNNNI